MSFVRPEVAARFARWREVLLWAAVAALGLWLGARGLAQGAWLVALPGGLALLTGGLLLRGAIRRVRFAALPPGEGVVMVDEGRIGFFGPTTGGFIDLAALCRVEIRPGRAPCWRLVADDGTVLDIPAGARGNEHLPDVLGVLPGIDFGAGLATLTDPAATFPRVIWRASTESRPTLT
ncbi:hypothetical protein [Rhodobacteraceae bacterium DSL-40]|uniref:hypothetical protein n=1 Tax=Amaricoccus sp. B4 TaxID=3368557 RepID=UPI000DABB174